MPVPGGQAGVIEVKPGFDPQPDRSGVHLRAGDGVRSDAAVLAVRLLGHRRTPASPTAGHGKAAQSTTVKFTALSAGTFDATAWYLPYGCVCILGLTCPSTSSAAVFNESQE